MKRIGLLLWCLAFLSAGEPVLATSPSERFRDDQLQSLVGVIQDIGRNSVRIKDELDKRVRYFVYIYDLSPFKKGDRVRIYYRRGEYIETMKKMTPVPCKAGGPNCGYIFTKPSR